jgi:hypothetical protein
MGFIHSPVRVRVEGVKGRGVEDKGFRRLGVEEQGVRGVGVSKDY